ncbi:MAG: mechanosensitive ion channel family protein [Dehalococcoidia bacterium]|uniref:mechanosensitive ion channel family protein n=1 Tax=Candidatus Amarobacter glycogenicus TaxID=3140699 RepID=UPI0031362459|nr:mechanosensitive ion channel family protein [Dehalococcoidia bacterium]
MPSFLWFDNSALDLTARQYGGLAIIVGAALAAQIIYLALSTFFIRTHNSPERRAFWRKERRRLDGVVFGTFIAVAILTGVRFLDLDVDLEDTVNVAARVLGAVCAGLLLLRGIAIVGNYLLDKAALTETRLDDQLIPLVRQTANVFVVLVGALFVLSNLDVDVGALIAGLGIGGLAVALAAQDTIKNLLGGITVLADRPFQVGDWIVVGDVEGTVEKVGFRSMRVRTFKDSLITVPNGQLTDHVVDNMGVRAFRRYDTTLRLPLSSTPDQVQAFCEGVRALLHANERVRQDYFFCEFERIGESTIEILLYCFFAAPDWGTELRAKHILNLDILRLADSLGLRLATPASTVQLDGWLGGAKPATTIPRERLARAIESLSEPGRAGQAAHSSLTHGFEPDTAAAGFNKGDSQEG